MVLQCEHCSPILRKVWHSAPRKELARDNLRTHLHQKYEELKKID